MAEEIRLIVFVAMLMATIGNIMEAVCYRKMRKECIEDIKKYHNLIFEEKNEFWINLGAYEAPEKGQLYLDLEGIRLVIENGEIEGWYIP